MVIGWAIAVHRKLLFSAQVVVGVDVQIPLQASARLALAGQLQTQGRDFAGTQMVIAARAA